MGPADRQARPGRPAPRVHRRHGVRPGGRGRRLEPPGRRQAQRLPHRGGAGQALRLGAGLAGRRHDDPDPRRPRLRDRRVAAGARREAGAGRAAAARHAHQPDLRGLHGDHAPADRPRGGRPAPAGRRRASSTRRRRSPTRPRRRRQGRRLLRASGSRSSPSARARSPAPSPSSAPLAGHLRYVERGVAQARPLDLLPRWAATRRALEQKGHAARPHRRHRRRALRDLVRLRVRAHDRPRATRRAATRRSSSPTCSPSRPGAAPTRCSASCGPTTTTTQYATAQKVLDGRYAWFEEDVLDPAGDGPMLPELHEPAEERFAEAPDVAEPPVDSQAEPVQ